MKKLLVLIGIQGSGKTTALNGFTEGWVLKPSTNRGRRFPEENEYHFVEGVWNSADYAWEIPRGDFYYGMLLSELSLSEDICITVFDPAQINVLNGWREHSRIETVTIGLDTLDSVEDQVKRVGADANRHINIADFEKQRAIVKGCDVVLKGDADKIARAVNAVARVLGGRGGVLSADAISDLISAGVLLDDADLNLIEPASYDLRIADQYWCQGKHLTIAEDKPLVIPPYSFALVKAREEARLPRFIVGSFDVRVSLFFSGVVLSNGPQVDPGYSGALFCMLHNASGTPVGINKNEHFASIQFQTLSENSIGYAAKYQNKKNFNDFLDGTDSQRPGGQIFEYITKASEKIEKDFKDQKNTQLVIIGVVLTILLAVVGYAYWQADKIMTSMMEKSTKLESTANETLKKFDEINKGSANLLSDKKSIEK
ncbi:dCTP deaminase [Delftia tsuruhatensis]|uniref:dCTP deaminase n=1 Tax=Delftia tsuruhatensis TaxID=180282 RepID=UPI000A449923|nr:hypothetical protein [Delftia tsuruhatensis]